VGVGPSNVKPIVQIHLVASAAALEGSGPVSKIPGHIIQVAGDGTRPAISAGNRWNERAKQNRFHFSKYWVPCSRLKSRRGEEDLPRPVYTTDLPVYTTDYQCTQQTNNIVKKLWFCSDNKLRYRSVCALVSISLTLLMSTRKSSLVL
jgi:hypothetical protein